MAKKFKIIEELEVDGHKVTCKATWLDLSTYNAMERYNAVRMRAAKEDMYLDGKGPNSSSSASNPSDETSPPDPDS
jgi:hypothetical protein